MVNDPTPNEMQLAALLAQHAEAINGLRSGLAATVEVFASVLQGIGRGDLSFEDLEARLVNLADAINSDYLAGGE